MSEQDKYAAQRPAVADHLSDGRLSCQALAKRYDTLLAGRGGIVIALDSETVDESKAIVEQTTRIDGVAGYKVGLIMVLRLGLAEAIRQLRLVTDRPLVYDHQKAGADVPEMASKFTANCRAARVDGLILFPTAGPRAVDAFVGEAIKHRMLPIVGGDLPFPDYNASGGGYVIDHALDLIFARAMALGADHFVVPGNTTSKLTHHAARLCERIDLPTLLVPGIGPLGGTLGSIVKAAQGARVFGVVGRAVYAARDPADAAKRLVAEGLGA
ncbi:MAG: orotidine 5'-phosphate decarboxylase / HUMPS family protein [Burkholderiales bacterium]